MRQEALLRVAQDPPLRSKLLKELTDSSSDSDREILLAREMAEVMLLSEAQLAVVRERAVWAVGWFLEERGDQDKDAEVFRNYLNSLQSLLQQKQ
jgi:hypothetical protein